MRKDIIIIALTWLTLIGCVASLYACDPRGYRNKAPEYERNIETLFEQAQQCPAMLAECNDPHYQNILANGTDCLSCKALALLYLREYARDWDDTLGETDLSDTLTEDAMSVLEDAELDR